MTNVASGTIQAHPVVSHDEWLSARTAFLDREKEFTRLRDAVNRERRELPWERVDQAYAFDTPAGRATLSDLFEGRHQLIVYHFMFAPEWTEGCKHCSFWADNFNGIGVHLEARDTTFVAISRAPLDRLDAFKRRMGWGFTWVSSAPSAFNYDYFVSFRPDEQASRTGFYNYRRGESGPDREGVSVFYKDDAGDVFHTYSTYARGIDLLNTAYNYLDLTPKGRDEDPGPPQAWVRFHDQY
jgi:predicted dithiol-disulfide oxidoreductase (DUF899 family)